MISKTLRHLISNYSSEIHDWFANEYGVTPSFFYSSVDIRYSGYKLTPVDTNLFPAGFNLISRSASSLAATKINDYFKTLIASGHINSGKITNVILIPEYNSRNGYYLDNILAIKSLIEKAGYNMAICLPNIEKVVGLQSANLGKVIIYPLKKCEENNIIFTEIAGKRFIPQLVIVNNDLSDGPPEILKNVHQYVIPPLGMGWYRRRKIEHFESYNEIANKFALNFNFDPWLITSIIRSCGVLNFKEKKGLECIANNAEKVFFQVQKKYDKYGIKEKPYLFVKADSGTYGMGVMVINRPEDIFAINKKDRTKMSYIKGGITNSRVILQEGIPSSLYYTDKNHAKHSAEALAYLIGGKTIDLIMRGNMEAGEYKNLNSKGMFFMNEDQLLKDANANKELLKNLTYDKAPYSLIAELASLAATRECYEPNWSI